MDFSKEKKRLGRDLNSMLRQDHEQKQFKSQHEKGSCDQELVADNKNGVRHAFEVAT